MTRREGLLTVVSGLSENEEIKIKYAEHLEELFDVIIPEKIGENFSEALKNNDYASAVKACADYYRQKPDVSIPELSCHGAYNISDAEKALGGYARIVNVDWDFPNGDVDFLFDPTILKGPRNHEWVWQFNRHNHWSNFSRTYTATGDEKYAVAFRSQLLKWIAQTDIPQNWNGPGSAWRTIECGIRLLGSWQITYDGFRRSYSIEDVVLLLMIASMHRQSVHLIKNPTGKNWLMMESNGVYTFSSLFTELSDSAENRRISADRLQEEVERQILPDGMHNELSPDYQGVVLSCALNFYSIALNLGMADEIPKSFTELLKKTVNAAILLSTPSFTQPRTNDTYTIKTTTFTARAEKLLGREAEYLFVNSSRKDGHPPKSDTASAFLPYAGFAVMRSDWGKDAAYMCFDVGPLGLAHVHQDKLNINIYKGDEELIYDDGGGQYEISDMRDYAISAYGHNTVLVDGLGQYRRAPLASESEIDAGWITNESFDYAYSVYDDTYGKDMLRPATHKREVRFCKPGFFCVTDTLTSIDKNTHDYELIFHLDTTKIKELEEYKNGVISDFGRKYEIAMIPLDDDSEDVELNALSAVKEPILRGWYNGRNERKLHEAITVSRKVCAVKDFKFTTLMFPVKAGDPLPKVRKMSDGKIDILFDGKRYIIDIESLNK
ncbi:MAG: alginate lyase family protein [Clostridia bacterium]|nr:alginate lyase family protein [Clostridia bacterium]